MAGLLTAAGYLLGRSMKKTEELEDKEDDTEKILRAQRNAANLTDDDCDALRRMFDNFNKK